MGKSVKCIIFTQIECLPWPKRKAEQLENNTLFWFKLDYYANNHIICITYAKFENIECFMFLSEK